MLAHTSESQYWAPAPEIHGMISLNADNLDGRTLRDIKAFKIDQRLDSKAKRFSRMLRELLIGTPPNEFPDFLKQVWSRVAWRTAATSFLLRRLKLL
jgi:hypothetical protein